MKTVIALGFFDGVHLGHQALMARAVERGREHGLEPAVFTFDRSPREFVTGKPVPLLTSPEERRRLVEESFPIRRVIVAKFDRAMMTMPWMDFLRVLAGRYNAGWLVAGHDFRFGHRNEGDAALLARGAAELGMGWDIIPAAGGGAGGGGLAAAGPALLHRRDHRPRQGPGVPHRPAHSEPAAGRGPADSRPGGVCGGGGAGGPALSRCHQCGRAAHGGPGRRRDRGEPPAGGGGGFLRPEEEFPGLRELQAQIAADAEAAREYFRKFPEILGGFRP